MIKLTCCRIPSGGGPAAFQVSSASSKASAIGVQQAQHKLGLLLQENKWLFVSFIYPTRKHPHVPQYIDLVKPLLWWNVNKSTSVSMSEAGRLPETYWLRVVIFKWNSSCNRSTERDESRSLWNNRTIYTEDGQNVIKHLCVENIWIQRLAGIHDEQDLLPSRDPILCVEDVRIPKHQAGRGDSTWCIQSEG